MVNYDCPRNAEDYIHRMLAAGDGCLDPEFRLRCWCVEPCLASLRQPVWFFLVSLTTMSMAVTLGEAEGHDDAETHDYTTAGMIMMMLMIMMKMLTMMMMMIMLVIISIAIVNTVIRIIR